MKKGSKEAVYVIVLCMQCSYLPSGQEKIIENGSVRKILESY